jgi:putative DNA primase/helicase
VIRGTDEGIWDRIKFVPFTVRIPDEKQDKELLPKLKAEAAGIMRWAVEGLAKYQEHGLQEPDTISKATAEYREEQDVLGQFLSAKCVRGPEHSIQARGFYRCYQTWANSNGEYYVLNERQFSQALAERGFRKVKQNKGAIWKGITTGEPQTPDGGFFS